MTRTLYRVYEANNPMEPAFSTLDRDRALEHSEKGHRVTAVAGLI